MPRWAALLAPAILARNTGFFGHLVRHPSSLGLRSLETVLRWDLLPAAATCLLGLSAWGLGGRLLPSADLPGAAFALGAGALALAVFAAALLGLLTIPVLGAISILGLLLARPSLPKIRWNFPLIGAALALSAWHAAITALAPATEWDALAYHLALPKLYLKAHGLAALPWLMHSHWPHLMEVFYALPLAFGLDNVPALWHAGLCAGWIFSVYTFGKRLMSPAAALAAAALLAAQPLVLDLAGVGHSDGACAFFSFLAIAATEEGWLLSAAFAGLAASCKLQGAVLIVLLTAWRGILKRRPGEALKFAVCALLFPAPWYLLTWSRTGTPFWPFLSGDPIEKAYIATQFWRGPGALLRFGPQYLLAPAAAAFALARRRALPGFLRLYLGLGLATIPFVWQSDAAWRYLLPFFPALALSAAWWAYQGGRAAKAALAFGFLPLAFSTENNQLFAVCGLRSTLEPGKNSRQIYLERSLDNYRFYERANAELPDSARVLLFREIRGFYLDRDYLWGDPLNQAQISYGALSDSRGLLARLQKLGVTHVLINEGLGLYQETPEYYDRRTLSLMDGALRLAGQPVLREGALTVYALENGAFGGHAFR